MQANHKFNLWTSSAHVWRANWLRKKLVNSILVRHRNSRNIYFPASLSPSWDWLTEALDQKGFGSHGNNETSSCLKQCMGKSRLDVLFWDNMKNRIKSIVSLCLSKPRQHPTMGFSQASWQHHKGSMFWKAPWEAPSSFHCVDVDHVWTRHLKE